MEDQRKEIFQDMLAIMKKFEKGMKVKTDGKTKYDMYGTKKVNLYNKEFDGMYFASVMIQKNSVGFHYFPQYANPKLLAELPENLKKCLKGKTCFHIKKRDEDLYKSIKSYVKIGYDGYKKMGWI